jgi:biopolymer transport protein ExbD
MAGDTNINDAAANHSEMPCKKRSSGDRSMQPPMTPMIDVTFQLLLFFLLTMTFRMAEGMIPGALPQKGGDDPNRIVEIVEPIRVRVLPAGRENTGVNYEVEGYSARVGSGAELYEVLKARVDQVGPKGPVQIASAPEVEWGYVVEVFNQATRCEFESVEFSRSGIGS